MVDRNSKWTTPNNGKTISKCTWKWNDFRPPRTRWWSQEKYWLLEREPRTVNRAADELSVCSAFRTIFSFDISSTRCVCANERTNFLFWFSCCTYDRYGCYRMFHKVKWERENIINTTILSNYWIISSDELDYLELCAMY